MKVDTIQTSFAGGEFGPPLFGRTDIAQYHNACEIVQNFLIRPYGPAISTPGTRYVATVSDSTLRTRLIPFTFNRTDSYVIEMGDLYMRFFTNRGQVVTPAGTEDLSAFTANLKAHWKCNDNTNSTTVIDAVGTHGGTATTLTTSLSTTAIVSTGFNLDGRYHISVADHADFTRTASSQPMTIAAWAYYDQNSAAQAILSKSGEYELSINSSDKLSFIVTSPASETSKLLLHCNGTDASTTFTDSSDSAHTVTANGNAQIDTAQSKFGGAAALFDGAGDYLSIPDHADWNFGSGDFTIDTWLRFASVSGNQQIVGQRVDASNFWALYLNNGANVSFDVFVDGAYTHQMNFAWIPNADTWYHLAMVRSGNDFKCFINGTQIGTTQTDTDAMPDLAASLIIGSFSSSSYFNGWLDEFRIVKGTAIWTSDFTPPDTAYHGEASNSWEVNSAISQGWHFIVIVFKGDGSASSDLKVFIDGVIVSTTFTADPSFVKMANTTSLFRIGTTSSAGAKNWNGKLDNIAFIHQELTAANIASLYSTSAYQLTTVFRENEVFAVHFSQLNDIIWLTHPNHPPQQLTRTSANEWTIADFDFEGGPFLDDNTDTTITITASATTGTVNLTVTPTTTSLFTLSSSTLGHHGAYWMIGGLAQTNATTGLQETGYVEITHVINGYTATATVIKNLKVSTATSLWGEGAWSAVRGYPARVSFHDWRLWFGRTNHEPQKIWGSKVFEYDQYALDTQDDDDALNLALSSNQSNEIQFLATARSIIAGTYGGAFVLKSSDSSTITPDNAHSNEEVGFGADPIMPKLLGNFLYYVQRFGKKIREMFYLWDIDSYKSVDKTILSPHILEDGVVDMAVQQNPDPILYCVLTNGTLATLTREVDQEMQAWSKQTTAGTYTSIAIIPSQSANYDEAWVIVERWIGGNQRKYVEFFEDIEIPDQQYDCLYLHSALTYNAYEATSTSSVTISLSASSGSVTLTSSSAYFKGTHVNKRLRAIDESGDTIGEGTITATASTTSITLSITTTFNALSYSAGRWGISVVSVTGLDHLDARTVGILADGLTESLTRTVASSTVTMGSNYFVIHVGLSYDQILFTLPKEAGAQRGTAQGKLQRFNEIALKVNRSTQDFEYGTDEDNLDNVNLSFTPSVTTLYTGILPPQGGGISMRGGYFRGAQIYIKNSNPLPIELLSIIGTLDTAEK